MIESVKQAVAQAQLHKPGSAGSTGTAQANAGFDAALLLALIPDDSGDSAAQLAGDDNAAQDSASLSVPQGSARADASDAPDTGQDPSPAATDPGSIGTLASGAVAQVMMALRGAPTPGATPGAAPASVPADRAGHVASSSADARSDTPGGEAANARMATAKAGAAASGADPVAGIGMGTPASSADVTAAQSGRAAIGAPGDAARVAPAGTSSEDAGDEGAERPARVTPGGASPTATVSTATVHADQGRLSRAQPQTADAAPPPPPADDDRAPRAHTAPKIATAPAAKADAAAAAAAAAGPAPSRAERAPTAAAEATVAAGAEPGRAADQPGGAGAPARSPNAAAAVHRALGLPHQGVDPAARPNDTTSAPVAQAPSDATDQSTATQDAAADGTLAAAGQRVDARPGTGTRRAPPAAAPGVAASAQAEPLHPDAREKIVAVSPTAQAQGDTPGFGGRPSAQGEQGLTAIIAGGGVHTGSLQSASPTQAPAGTAPAQFSLGVPIDAPDFHPAFAGQIERLALQGLQSAEIVVTPRDMGPIRVELSMSGDSLSVAFSAAHPETTRAIEQSLATLRTMLSEHGITLSQASVGSGAFGQPQERGAARSTSTLFRNRSGNVLEQAVPALDAAPVPPPRSRGPGTIDLFA